MFYFNLLNLRYFSKWNLWKHINEQFLDFIYLYPYIAPVYCGLTVAIKKPWKCFLNVPIHRTLKDLVNLSLRKFRLGKVIIWHKFDPISCCWQDYFTFFRHAFLPKVFVCLFRDSRSRLRLVLRFSFVRIRKTVDRSSRDDVLKRIFRKLFSTCKRLEEVPFTIRKFSYTYLFLNPILLYSKD